MSVPAPVDAARRRLLYAPHLGWRDVPIADCLEKDLRRAAPAEKIPVIVENDATAAALYEARLRLRQTNAEPLKNFILLPSGTGIGVGLVIEGEVYRGADESAGFAGEFGHVTIVARGRRCVCGNRGCWEQYASASAASSIYASRERLPENTAPPRFVEIVARAEAGEPRARRTFEMVGENLGIGNVITGLGVPNVIVSGRLIYGWRFIEPALREAVGKSMAGKLRNWTIECGEPKGAALGGALETAVEEYLAHGLKI